MPSHSVPVRYADMALIAQYPFDSQLACQSRVEPIRLLSGASQVRRDDVTVIVVA